MNKPLGEIHWVVDSYVCWFDGGWYQIQPNYRVYRFSNKTGAVEFICKFDVWWQVLQFLENAIPTENRGIAIRQTKRYNEYQPSRGT